MNNCLEAVGECELFLGPILPRYGSGKETTHGLSITHCETLKAIEGNSYRELAEKHLPKLKDVAAIRSRVKREGKRATKSFD